MRIDEFDPKHKKFKEVILDHELTEEQLDEILPVIAAVGGLARVGAMAGGALARGAAAIGRGIAGAARGAVRGAAQGVKNVSGAVGQAGQQLGQAGKNYVKNKVQSFATDTANKLASQGTQGTQGTIGTDQSQGQQAQLQRGQELQIPQTDPKNPNKTVQTKMKVKNVSGREVELQPSKKQPGQPNVPR